MGKKIGGQKKAQGKRWTKVHKPRRKPAPVAAMEPLRPAARCLCRRAPVVHRGSGDGTPGFGASEGIPPETQLIGVAVRRVTPDDGTFTYGEVVQYKAKANRFLVRFQDDDDEYFTLMTYAEIIRDRVGSERSDEGLDMDAPYCLPCKTKTLWVLDLFSCLKSVKRGLEDVLRDYRRNGWTVEVVHLDADRRRDPDVLCDIRDWKKELVDELGFRPFDFHIIWMSPDCRFFSQAGNPTSADIARGVELVAAARDVCEFFRPNCFFLENPWCGPRCLRKQDDEADVDIHERAQPRPRVLQRRESVPLVEAGSRAAPLDRATRSLGERDARVSFGHGDRGSERAHGYPHGRRATLHHRYPTAVRRGAARRRRVVRSSIGGTEKLGAATRRR